MKNKESINVTKSYAIPLNRVRCNPYVCQNEWCVNKKKKGSILEIEPITFNLAHSIWRQFWHILSKMDISEDIYYATVYTESHSENRLQLNVAFQERIGQTIYNTIARPTFGPWSAKIRFKGGPAVDCPFMKKIDSTTKVV